MPKNVKTAVEETVLPVIENMGYIYVDTEYKKQGKDWVLTIFADTKEGINLDDCEKISRAIEVVLDEKDIIKDPYCLCVSSPGLDRPLKTKRDFNYALNKVIDVKLYKPFEDKKEFSGLLTVYGEKDFTIQINENQTMTFTYEETAKVSLNF